MCRAEVFLWVSIHVAESESESFSCPKESGDGQTESGLMRRREGQGESEDLGMWWVSGVRGSKGCFWGS